MSKAYLFAQNYFTSDKQWRTKNLGKFPVRHHSLNLYTTRWIQAEYKMSAFSSRRHEIQFNIEKAKIAVCIVCVCIYMCMYIHKHTYMPYTEISDIVRIVTFRIASVTNVHLTAWMNLAFPHTKIALGSDLPRRPPSFVTVGKLYAISDNCSKERVNKTYEKNLGINVWKEGWQKLLFFND